MSALAVILARRGSKGVPGKNMAPVAGRPCLAWSIEAALSARGVSRVVVSTDWPQAAALAREMGAEAIERPAELANDTASVDAAARHAVASLHASAGPVIILYANVPVRPPDLIDRAVDLLASARADSVQSYAPVGKHHPWWTCRLNPDTAEVGPWEGEKLFHGAYRRQDLPPAFIPDGGVLAVSHRSLFLEIAGAPPGPHAFLGREENRRGVVTREGDVIDIDSPIDLVVADAVLRSRARTASTPWSLHPVATGTFT